MRKDINEAERIEADKINKMDILNVGVIKAVAVMNMAGFVPTSGYPSEVKIIEGEIGHDLKLRYKRWNGNA